MTKIKFKHVNQYKVMFMFFKSSTKWFENCPVRATNKKASEKSGAFCLFMLLPKL